MTDLKHWGPVLKFHSDAFCPHPGQPSGTRLQTEAKTFPALFHVSPAPSCPHQILFLQATVLCSPTVKSTVASGHCSSPATGICQKVILHCTKCPAQCCWPFSCPLAPVGEACANQVQLGGQFLWEPVWLSDSYRTQTAPDPDQTGYRRTG